MRDTLFGLTLEEFDTRDRSRVCWRCAAGWVEHVLCGYGRLCEACYGHVVAIHRKADEAGDSGPREPGIRRLDVPEVGSCRCRPDAAP